MRKTLFILILVAIPVLLIEAIQPSSILPIPTSKPAPGALTQTDPLTRIFRAPAALLETGLELPDLINSMAFDPDGNLWLASAEGGPYLYSVETNELTNMIFPETVYNLFSGDAGVWILTSKKALLYRGNELLRTIHFPEGVVPISGIQEGDSIYFGTTEGLFGAGKLDDAARLVSDPKYISSLISHRRGLILITSSGLYIQKKQGRLYSHKSTSFVPSGLLPKNGIFSGIVCTENGLYAASEQDGILQMHPTGWKKIRFARKNLNLNSSGSAVLHRNAPWFGTLDGSVIVKSQQRWEWMRVSDFPVTALAQNGESLFAWSGGKLFRILYDEEKTEQM